MYKYNIVRSPYDTSTISGDLTNYLYKFAVNSWYQQKIILSQKLAQKSQKNVKMKLQQIICASFTMTNPLWPDMKAPDSDKIILGLVYIAVHSGTCYIWYIIYNLIVYSIYTVKYTVITKHTKYYTIVFKYSIICF